MKILALDTSTKYLSLALEVDGQRIEKHALANQNHGAIILSLIQEMLTQANCSIKELDLLAFGNGPGSFTGLRLAGAIVQGLALPFAIKIIGISTLQAMAQQAYRCEGIESCLCALDARTQHIYLGRYHLQDGIMVATEEEALINPQAFVDTPKSEPFFVGDGFAVYQDLFLEKNYFKEVQLRTEIWPCASDILDLAKYAYAEGKYQTVLKMELNYLQTPKYGQAS